MSTRTNQRQRVALVTGCSEPTSLGVATVHRLHKNGWKVIATARKVETMQALKSSGIDVSPFDISDLTLSNV
jgi:NADP-dependent 3-hydroxy acid dehydrogenase YdfG